MDTVHINDQTQISLVETSTATGWEEKFCAFFLCVFFQSPNIKYIAWVFTGV